MGIYASRDIEVTDQGDIVIDTNGDIKLASPLRTVSQAVNSAILTNKGELSADPYFGASLSSFFGKPNSPENRKFMEMNIIDTINTQGLIRPEDIEVDVVPIDIHKAAVIAKVNGSFIDFSDPVTLGSTDVTAGVTMGYLYPFIGNSIERIDSDQ